MATKIESINVKLDNGSGFELRDHDITTADAATARHIINNGAGQLAGRVTFVFVEDDVRRFDTYRVTARSSRKVAAFSEEL